MFYPWAKFTPCPRAGGMDFRAPPTKVVRCLSSSEKFCQASHLWQLLLLQAEWSNSRTVCGDELLMEGSPSTVREPWEDPRTEEQEAAAE